jgi:hypothetical protein
LRRLRNSSWAAGSARGCSPGRGPIPPEHGFEPALITRPWPRPRTAGTQAALEILAIVVYGQPVTRAEIRHIRGVDSHSAIETLMSRGLIAEDPRFGGRGRPAYLVSTAAWFADAGFLMTYGPTTSR